MQAIGIRVNDALAELYLKASVCKRNEAKKVIAIEPNYYYARQDRALKAGEPVSSSLQMQFAKIAGVDHILTTDLHSPIIKGMAEASNIQLTDISPTRVMADYIQNCMGFTPEELAEKVVIVSPDAGGLKRVNESADVLGCDKALIDKKRTGHHQAVAENLLGDVTDKICFIRDDMIDSGGTIAQAAAMLKDKGVKQVYVIVSHGLFNGNAVKNLNGSKLDGIIVTNAEGLKESSKSIKKLGVPLDLSNEYANKIRQIITGK